MEYSVQRVGSRRNFSVVVFSANKQCCAGLDAARDPYVDETSWMLRRLYVRLDDKATWTHNLVEMLKRHVIAHQHSAIWVNRRAPEDIDQTLLDLLIAQEGFVQEKRLVWRVPEDVLVVRQFQGEHRFLSNFWPVSVELDGMMFPSVENAYQAAKTADTEKRKSFQNIPAGQAKRLGKQLLAGTHWLINRKQIMEVLLRQKFQAGSPLARKLLNTAPAILVEGNTWKDSYWGVDWKKGGQNLLGELLMQIRSELQQVEQAREDVS